MAIDFLPGLVSWESRIPFMYLDSATDDAGQPSPNVTIGVGCLLSTLAVAQSLSFMLSESGRPLRVPTLAEIEWDWRRVRSLPPGNRASYYQSPSVRLYLEQDAIDDLARSRLDHDCLPAVRRIFPAFDALPNPAQQGIVDMAWNMGAGKLRSRFPKFIAAVNRRDFATAASECHRKSCRDERNDWCAALFCASVAAPTS